MVLVGGCFDILHVGHLKFLEKAKKQAEILIVLLEADKRVRSLKGDDRPVNTQRDRAYLLSRLRPVDYVVLLPTHISDADYDKIVKTIRPKVIAVTRGDANIKHKRRTAKLAGARVVAVVKNFTAYSTSKIINKDS